MPQRRLNFLALCFEANRANLRRLSTEELHEMLYSVELTNVFKRQLVLPELAHRLPKNAAAPSRDERTVQNILWELEQSDMPVTEA
jgi:hypothetical protein